MSCECGVTRRPGHFVYSRMMRAATLGSALVNGSSDQLHRTSSHSATAVAESGTLMLVSGADNPTRAAELEQTLIRGAHGPRRLHVIVVGQAGAEAQSARIVRVLSQRGDERE